MFALEVVDVEDRISIELNVGTEAEPNFKDASALSRGQYCTALLPLLLARRDTPLLIDQPEDNLDNHFIYETVVETGFGVSADMRQMIFVTHNANIPFVLGEADLVVVMDSDGRFSRVHLQVWFNRRNAEVRIVGSTRRRTWRRLNSADGGMSAPDEAKGLIDHLQRLAAVERSREARHVVSANCSIRTPRCGRCSLLGSGTAGDSRLRHLVRLTQFRLKPLRAQVVPQLSEWLAAETDEFTRNALAGALGDTLLLVKSRHKRSTARNPTGGSASLFGRIGMLLAVWLIGWLRRNSLAEPHVAVLRLNHAISELPDSALRARLDKLSAELAAGAKRQTPHAPNELNDTHFRDARNFSY